ncbi:MAG: hypothetical protein DMG15_03280 [Acidobacteria bacterium]|nr:MAG: hypothetical protein DMG15_03280 [Acidobacteriota bacterium]
MSYEPAFEALKNGDFRTAVPLLEKAALETAYTSDLINHAYTLALYHAGERSRLADVAFAVANSLLEHDPASAMDYFQRALVAGLDAARLRRIGQIFETWAASAPSVDRPLLGVTDRVAHVVGSLLPGASLTDYIKMLASSLKSHGIESTIFTTEWAASWFFNPAGDAQSQKVEIEAAVKIASVEGDFTERAQRIAQAIRDSGIRVALFHADLTQQITARVAAVRPAPIQINVNHRAEMDADLFHARIHLFQAALGRTRFSCPAEWIPPASDIETRLQTTEPVTRQSMGLESASTVSATFGHLRDAAGSGYLRALSEIMKRFPKHFHIFAGEGTVKAVRSHLHSAGVLPRVRFLGRVVDVAPLLELIDVYLASFPESNSHAVLDAMGAGKPVVVLKSPVDSEYTCTAELVGMRELVAPGEADYVEIADRLLRTPAHHAAQGRAMQERFRKEFRPERLGRRYKELIEKVSGK